MIRTARAGRAATEENETPWFGRAMAVLAVLALVAITAISVEILTHTQKLRGNVAATSSIGDANVRTVAQTQREVLRLQLALAEDQDAGSVQLSVALTDQRTQESALPYHAQALRAPALLEQARTARGIWERAVRPEVERYLATGAPEARTLAMIGLQDLELRYNEIARVAALNRKAITGEANKNSLALLDHSRHLIQVVGAGIVVGAAALGGLLIASRRLSATRRRHRSELVDLNAELSELAEVVRTTGALVARTDRDGRLVWVNDAVLRRFSVTTAALVGRSPADLGGDDARDVQVTVPETAPETCPEAHPEAGDPAARSGRDGLAVALGRGTAFTAELQVRGGDDEPAHHLTLTATPVHDGGGDHVGWSVVGTDITDQVAARALLEQARVDAERVADEKSRFLATMSHEIRTPLHAVLGLQDVLAHSPLDADQTRHLAQARVSAQHLLDLVNDVLDFSALDAGRLENVVERCDVRACVETLVGLFGHEAEARGLALTSRVDADVPDAVLLDTSHLRRVLVNLIGNAVKYTAQGSVAVEADWSPDPRGGEEGTLRLQVRDTGVGIDPAEVEVLFEPFARARRTRDSSGGTGLGLWICRRVVDLLGGRITLAPGVDGGTVATVELPTRPAGGLSEAPAPIGRPGAAADVSGLRVLIADDDDINRFVLRSLLGRLGIEPVIAAGGQEAMSMLLSEDVDVALLDQRMPDRDGTAVAADVREVLGAGCPRLVVVTADALPGDRERLLAAGMDDYLAKPVTLEALRVALQRVAPRAVELPGV